MPIKPRRGRVHPVSVERMNARRGRSPRRQLLHASGKRGPGLVKKLNLQGIGMRHLDSAAPTD